MPSAGVGAIRGCPAELLYFWALKKAGLRNSVCAGLRQQFVGAWEVSGGGQQAGRRRQGGCDRLWLILTAKLRCYDSLAVRGSLKTSGQECGVIEVLDCEIPLHPFWRQKLGRCLS